MRPLRRAARPPPYWRIPRPRRVRPILVRELSSSPPVPILVRELSSSPPVPILVRELSPSPPVPVTPPPFLLPLPDDVLIPRHLTTSDEVLVSALSPDPASSSANEPVAARFRFVHPDELTPEERLRTLQFLLRHQPWEPAASSSANAAPDDAPPPRCRILSDEVLPSELRYTLPVPQGRLRRWRLVPLDLPPDLPNLDDIPIEDPRYEYYVLERARVLRKFY